MNKMNKQNKKGSIVVSLSDAVKVVGKIEQKWYAIEPHPVKLSDELYHNLANWGTKEVNQATQEVDLTGVGFKLFIRSYRKALEELFNSNKALYTEEDLDLQGYVTSIMKRSLKIKIGNFIFTLKLKPAVGDPTADKNPRPGHLGNCVLEGVGSYSDIWPILSLITDCDVKSNQMLARKFLHFAKASFHFTEDDLKEINNKFRKEKFHHMIESLCRYVTGIAFLYTFMEPARRLETILNEKDEFEIRPIQFKDNTHATYASSMITILKCIRDGVRDSIFDSNINLESAFSPDSNFVLFTKKGANSAGVATRNFRKKNNVTQAITYFFKYEGDYLVDQKKLPTAWDIKNTVLNPDSDADCSSEEEENEDQSSEDEKNTGSENAYDDIGTKGLVKKCVLF